MTKVKKNKQPFNGKNLSAFERGFNTGFDKARKEFLQEGQLQGYEYAMTILLMVLKDKFDPSSEELHTLFNYLDSYHEMIINGNASFQDMNKALHEEYNIKFKFIRR